MIRIRISIRIRIKIRTKTSLLTHLQRTEGSESIVSFPQLTPNFRTFNCQLSPRLGVIYKKKGRKSLDTVCYYTVHNLRAWNHRPGAGRSRSESSSPSRHVLQHPLSPPRGSAVRQHHLLFHTSPERHQRCYQSAEVLLIPRHQQKHRRKKQAGDLYVVQNPN